MAYLRLVEQAKGEKDPQRARQQLDLDLRVTEWRVPGTMRQRAQTADGTPAWWRGDADASQSFLAAMGMRLDGDG